MERVRNTQEAGVARQAKLFEPLRARNGDEFCKLQNIVYASRYKWKRFPMTEWPIEHAAARFIDLPPGTDLQLGSEPGQNLQVATLTCLDIRIRGTIRAKELVEEPEKGMAFMPSDERRAYDGVIMLCLEGMTMSISRQEPHVYNKVWTQIAAQISMRHLRQNFLAKSLASQLDSPMKVNCHGTPTQSSLDHLEYQLDLKGERDYQYFRVVPDKEGYTGTLPLYDAGPAPVIPSIQVPAGESSCLEVQLAAATQALEGKKRMLEVAVWNEAESSQAAEARQIRPRIDPDADIEGMEFEHQEYEYDTPPRMLNLDLGLAPPDHEITWTPLEEMRTSNPGHEVMNAPYIDFFDKGKRVVDPSEPAAANVDTGYRIHDVAALQLALAQPDTMSTYTACTSAPLSNDLAMTFHSFFKDLD